MPKLTATLTAIAVHYAAHPELPAWCAIDVELDGTIRLHLAINDVDEPTATALITWAETLHSPELRLQRYKGSPASLTYDQVQLVADLNGQTIVIHREVPGFGDYIGAPIIEKLGQAVIVPATIDQLRAFHSAGLDDFGVAA